MHSLFLRRHWLTAVLMVVLGLAFGIGQPARTAAPSADSPTAAAPGERFIVKLRATAQSAARQAAPGRLGALAVRQGLALQEGRHIVSGMHLMRVAVPAGAQSAA